MRGWHTAVLFDYSWCLIFQGMKSPCFAVGLVWMEEEFSSPQASSGLWDGLSSVNIHMVLNIAPCGNWEGGRKTLPLV